MLKIRSWLAHPLTRNINIDDPCVTGLRRRIIQEGHFLRLIFLENSMASYMHRLGMFATS